MSAPEQQDTPPAGPGFGDTAVHDTPGAGVVVRGAGPTRTQRATVWAGCHLGELAGIAITASLAITVTVWFALVAALIAAMWAGQEWHDRRTSKDNEDAAGEKAGEQA